MINSKLVAPNGTVVDVTVEKYTRGGTDSPSAGQVMSRSRRAPYFTEGYGGKARRVSKRSANARLKVKPGEDMETLATRSPGAYKKEYESWSICDWKFYSPKDKKAGRK